MGSTNNSTKKDVVKKEHPQPADQEPSWAEDIDITEQVSKNIGRDLSEEEKENIGELSTKVLSEGMSTKDAMGITNEMLEGMYSFGYRLYNNGKYVQAAPVFRLLILLDPMQAKYMMGLAACFHMTKEYQNALTTYSLCSLIDLDDPLPYYHSSDCYLQLGQQDMALKSLEISLRKMKDLPNYANLYARVLLNYEALKEGQSFALQIDDPLSKDDKTTEITKKTA